MPLTFGPSSATHPGPAGPRRRNEGIEDEDQGIVAAEASADGATVTVSLLAAVRRGWSTSALTGFEWACSTRIASLQLPCHRCVLHPPAPAQGFVVGPGGASVRAICAATGADVRSYTESQDGRRVRVFVIAVGVGVEMVVGRRMPIGTWMPPPLLRRWLCPAS